MKREYLITIHSKPRILRILCLLFLCIVLSSHSGRTDQYGGHYDRSTGEYHYHNGSPTYNRDAKGSSGSGFIYIIIAGVGVFFLYSIIIERRDKRRREIERQKQEDVLRRILEKYTPDYDVLFPIPQHIKIGYFGRCKFCDYGEIHHKTNLYIRFMTRTNYHYVCLNCAKKRESLGAKQPISMFKDELIFADKYYSLLNKFISNAKAFPAENDLKPSEEKLRLIFNQEIIKRAQSSNEIPYLFGGNP